MGHIKLTVILVIVILAGCSNQPTQDYADSVLNRPMPTSDNQKMQECTWIRGEIARQQSIGAIAPMQASSPMMGMVFRAKAQQNVAALESRAANIQCNAAFSNAPATTTPTSFESCFARCKQYTERTKEQCFDSCNK
jgi:hypothetical protein